MKKHLASLFLLLCLTWWLLSGHGGWLLPMLGLASVALATWLSWRMDVVDRESHPLHLSLRLLRFWAWLLREIVVANVQVVRLVLSPRAALRPEVLEVPTRQRSALGRVVLGNAITLTPGTVTLDLRGNRLLVHALTPASARDLRSGVIDQRVPGDLEEPLEIPLADDHVGPTR